jgi:hypothetical protein
MILDVLTGFIGADEVRDFSPVAKAVPTWGDIYF